MVVSSSSQTAARFLAAIGHGHGLKASARMAGIGKEVGYRFLRVRYLELRRSGLAAAAANEAIGFSSSRVTAWEALVDQDDRHHLRVDASREVAFWLAFEAGADLSSSAEAAQITSATAYRWVHRRFHELRSEGVTGARVARQLRLSGRRAAALEQERDQRMQRDAAALAAARRESAALIDAGLEVTDAVRRRRKRVDAYWQLMRDGVSNVDACRLLGMSRRAGTLIRKQSNFTIPPLISRQSTGRYLTARERMQIADLLRMGCSMRQIGAQLGRHPSTISRELGRHRDPAGNYLPRTAHHDAQRQRARTQDPETDGGHGASPHRPTQAQPVLVTGGDQRLVTQDIPTRCGHAGLPRDHLPSPAGA